MLASRVAAVFALLITCAPLWAGLIDNHFPGKTEAGITKEFEEGLPAFLAARLKDSAIPHRMYAPVAKNTEVYVQLTAVNGSSTVWTTLVNIGWYKATANAPSGFAMEPFGKEYTFDIGKLPPAEVAAWFHPKNRTPAEVVSCACWLAAKGEMWLSNAEVAALAVRTASLKPDVEAWLAEKNGWSVPPDGLEMVATHDLKRNEEGALLLTKEAKTAWFKRLDDEAKDAFKAIEKLQGNDIKSKPGYRKSSPGMRLEQLQNHIAVFVKTYAGTSFMQKKTKDVQQIADTIATDLKWIEDEIFKAERKGIDGDWQAASKHYELLQRTDPFNPELTQLTAVAFSTAAKITDGGRKAADPAAAKRAALLYEHLIVIYPAQLGYHNHAGLNWLAGGDKTKSIEHHEEVLRRTNEKKELSETDKSNRDFAEGQLKLIK